MVKVPVQFCKLSALLGGASLNNFNAVNKGISPCRTMVLFVYWSPFALYIFCFKRENYLQLSANKASYKAPV